MNATDAPNTKHSASEAIAATALIQIATLPPPQCAQRPLTPRSSGDVSPRRSASQAISPNHHLRSSPNHNQSQVPDPFHTPTRKRQQNPMLMLTPVSPGHVRQVSSQASEPPSRPHHETHHTHQAPAALSVSPQPTSADPGSLVSPSIRHEGLGMPLPLPRPMREPFQRESFKFVNESISPKFSPDKNANPTSQRGPASRALQNIVFHSHHHDSKPKRHRLNKFQLDVLNMVFERAFYPSAATREALAAKLDMEPKAVQVWFQNQRQNWRGKVQKTQDPSQKDQDLVSSEASAPSSDAPVPARPRGKRQSAKNTLKREDAHEGKDVDLDEIFAQLSRPQGDQPVDISVPRTPSPRPQPLS
ncbi:uncharacterized protein BJ171DRAFT_507392 [Polychytrium aggregatum]|uniref:uncharacterized protein n=1 Tax=Polychytrium aggregatum TaxID=110093 RepID=UPI0022FEEA7B|nr:uncharacterized protein BJ171DRAFT_507392 [Polychytrium aggregatum]KAI9204015.1 hypothetical protein BJ171DRAFT_507392 [Polychytrium aggregatum]